MKRTNLVLDADLLREATRVLGAKTYSAAVNEALAEVLRLRKLQDLPRYSRQLGEAPSGAGLRCRPSKPGRSRDQRERRPEIGRPRRFGRGLWQGDLAEMRRDRRSPRPRS